MRNQEGESGLRPIRPNFDRRLELECHGYRITFDTVLPPNMNSTKLSSVTETGCFYTTFRET